jgi:putative hydrolase of the HAD superfamily
MLIKAVVFDFGGILAEGRLQTEPFEADLLQHLRGLGYQVRMTDLRHAQEAALGHLEDVRTSNRELSFEEVYSEVLTRLGVPVEEEIMAHMYELYRRNFSVAFFPGVEDLLRALSEKYDLAILSNTLSDIPRRFIAEQGLAELFRTIVCSRDLGIRKPDERIFRHVLDQLETTPREAIFVGDTLKEDMVGARKVGLTSIWVRENEEEADPECAPDYTVKAVLELPKILKKIE